MNTKKIHNQSESIISCGIICIKIDNNIIPYPSFIENFLVNKILDIDEYNLLNLSNLNKIDYYKNKIKFLLVQRRHSFSYVDFIRGKYDETNIITFANLLNLMTPYEINNIINNTFENLWSDLWQKTSKYKIYNKEYENSLKKFQYLKLNYNLLEFIHFEQLYLTPEWGFPKGRHDKHENNLDCAIREFEEETGLCNNDYIVLNRLNTVNEIVIDFDKTIYKLIYYIGLSLTNTELKITTEHQKYEIGDIQWVTYEEAISKIRCCYNDKIKIIHKIFFTMVNLIENIISNKHLLFD